MIRTILVCAGGLCLAAATDTGSADWPMWGGSPERNMVSAMSGAPLDWDIKSRKNVRWMAPLGSQTYGNPVVAGGQVYIGTNNDAPRNPGEEGDRGVLMCFRESDGQFLWQHTTETLGSNETDWPQTGVCSSPLVEDGRLYYITNRAEVACLDPRGDGKGGPKVIWKFDMMREVGSSPHNKASSSPASHGNLIFAATSNGRDESHERVPSPKAPSMIALDKRTGKLVWQVNHVGDRILDGQWSSPAVAVIDGAARVVIGEGDGFVRAYAADSGKKLWEFDTNPKDAVWPKNRNLVISTPVVSRNRVYIANGQDPESGGGPGHLYAIDAVSGKQVWHYDKIGRSISTGAVYDGLVFYADLSGFLHCLDAASGKPYWTHDLLATVWGSPIVIGGKVYVGDEDGDVTILEAAREKKVVAEMNLGSNVYSTPVPANGRLYIANRNQLWSLGPK